MKRLLRVTSRAYPANGRAELVDALCETYGDAIPFRESVRVLTNGLQLKTRMEFHRPVDLLRNAYFLSSCMFACAVAASQLMNHWELHQIDLYDITMVVAGLCWTVVLLSRRVRLVRFLGSLMTALTFWSWTTQPFSLHPSLSRWLVLVVVAGYLVLTALPTSKLRLAALIVGVTAIRLFWANGLWWHPSVQNWPRPVNFWDLSTNLLFVNVLLWVVPFLVLKMSWTETTNDIRRTGAPVWPIIWGSTYGALLSGALRSGGSRAHLVMYVFGAVVVGLFAGTALLSPWRPLWWASLSWFFVVSGFLWFVNFGPIIPGLWAILFFVGGVSLALLTRRTKRLLLA
jgi:hypothetical protein